MTIGTLNALEMAKEHSARIYFIYVDLAGDPFYACTGTRTYTFGGDDYLGIGEVAGLGDVTNTADIAARQLVLTLSGVDPWITEPLLSRQNYKNKAVVIYRGFLDQQEVLIEDPDAIWRGRADIGSVELDEQVAIARLTCEPDTARLLRPNVSRYADEDHQLRFPGDKFYEFLAQMEKKDVLWGGIRVIPGTSGGGGSRGGPGHAVADPWSNDHF